MDEVMKALVIAVVCVISIAIFLVYFSAKQEAKIFNKFSTTKITVWEAFWADFRILPTDK